MRTEKTLMRLTKKELAEVVMDLESKLEKVSTLNAWKVKKGLFSKKTVDVVNKAEIDLIIKGE